MKATIQALQDEIQQKDQKWQENLENELQQRDQQWEQKVTSMMQQYWEEKFANMMLSSSKQGGPSKPGPTLEDDHHDETDDSVDSDDS